MFPQPIPQPLSPNNLHAAQLTPSGSTFRPWSPENLIHHAAHPYPPCCSSPTEILKPLSNPSLPSYPPCCLITQPLNNLTGPLSSPKINLHLGIDFPTAGLLESKLRRKENEHGGNVEG